MSLNIIIGDYSMDLEVSPQAIAERREALERLEAHMDQGVQLGREWIDHPSITQRCQGAADRLLEAIETHNQDLALLAAAYILTRKPGVIGVKIDTNGEPGETEFY